MTSPRLWLAHAFYLRDLKTYVSQYDMERKDQKGEEETKGEEFREEERVMMIGWGEEEKV